MRGSNQPGYAPRPAAFRRIRRGLVLALLLTGLAALLPAAEVQQHGLVFEEWVRTTFFENCPAGSYTQKWDIPAAANRTHGGIPVNPKAAKYGAPVDLGDALRQFDIAEPFILVIGYWRQDGDTKRFVKIVAARIEPDQWRQLWGPVTRHDLERLAAVIKDRTLTPAGARAAARQIKRAPPFTAATILVNPKIDSKNQRRLQCSLRFADVFKHLVPDADPTPQERPELWGVECVIEAASPPRAFSAR